MYRKITLGLLAAASIGATALLPTAASAHPMGWGWGYGGWYGGPTVVLSTPVVTAPVITDPCVQKMPVQTRHGVRYRYVNTCGF